MRDNGYYTLVASLPHLPRFNQAERLPITRERLLERLTLLSPAHYKLAALAAEFISWRRQPVGRTNAEIVSIYNQGVETIFESQQLKPLFELSVNQKTILVALRRHENGLPRPSSGELWGAGELVSHIEYNWDKPFFKLRYSYPWIVQAQSYLKDGETLKLDYLLFNLVWNRLDYLLFKNYFGFEVVVAYLLKWDILQQWLTYNTQQSQTRFEELVLETIDEYEQHSNRNR
jgi:hypothetical protein